MDEADEARQLLAQQRYKDAGAVLDRLLITQKENDSLWYMRGIVALKLKGYDAAQEYFERALSFRKKAEYYRMKGMAHFEIFELQPAIESFLGSVALEPSDAVSHFFLAMCYLLLDDPKSAEHIKKAYELEPKKTKQLVTNFYTLFIGNDPRINEAQRKSLEERIRAINAD